MEEKFVEEMLEKFALLEKRLQELIVRRSQLLQENEKLKKEAKEKQKIIESLSGTLNQQEERQKRISGRLDELIKSIEEMDGVKGEG